MNDNFDPQSSDIEGARVMGARFDGLAAHIDVMGGKGTMVDREGRLRPVSDVMATLSVVFLLPETGSKAVALAQFWLDRDSPVRVQTFADGSVKITDDQGSTLQSDCLTSG